MDIKQFDQFFSERIEASIRTQALRAIAQAPRLANGYWFDPNDGCPCPGIRTAMAAVNETWTKATFPPRKDEHDNEHEEQKIARALGVTTYEVHEMWVFWDKQMTEGQRQDFVLRMRTHVAVQEYRTAQKSRPLAFRLTAVA